jgi:gliding motility-associated-like protein
VTSSISSVLAGDYTVTVTDAHLCTTQNTYTVNSSSGPSIVVDSTFDARCYGASTGRIYISVTSGTPPYTYLWNDGAVIQDRTGLAAGTYTVTVTDFNTCTASTQITIGQATLIVPSFTVQDASCNQSNGSASVVAIGGNGVYTYLWETGSVSNQITNQFAGVYSVTITDGRGCSVNDSATIGNSGQASILLSTQVNPLCYGLNTGMLTVNVSGGISPYQIIWSNGDTGVTADTLVAGTYTVTVTDQTACSSQASFTITQPDELTLQLSSINEHCNKADGSITVNVSGGTGIYTYLWSTSSNSNQIGSLTAGTYTVSVTDQNNCQASSSAVLINIAAPIINTISVIDASCYNSATGSVDIEIQGGTPPYTYLWSNGNVTQDLTSVVAGSYTVTVTDTFACVTQSSFLINQPSELLLQVTVDDAGCNNNNGSILVVTSGGVGPYSYLWSDGSVNDNLQNLFAGSYTVTVTDFHSCTVQQNITVNNLNAATVTLDSLIDVSCKSGSNGAIYVTVSGGASPYTYLWSDNSVDEDLLNVPAGVYTLTVSDNNGCVSVYTDTINEPLPLLANAVITDAKCGLDNGIITVTPSGGSLPYSFLWSSSASSSTISSLVAGDYTITVTDSRSCTVVDTFTVINTGSPSISLVKVDSVSCNGLTDGAIDIDVAGGVGPYAYTWIGTTQITQDITGLQAGGYSVIVTDFVGCTSTNSYTVYQPSAINISFPQLTNAACGSNNGSIVVAVSGGDPGYSLLWSNGAVNDTIANLNAGSYTVTVTDQHGCSQSSQANISNISGPSIASVDSANVSCPGLNDGFITITVSGGTAPYTYSWSTLPDVTPTVSNLSGGTYTVTVKDALNCLVLRSVTITAPNAIAINSVIPQKNPPYNLTCYQSADGDIFLSVSGGTAPYGFIWSNGSITQNISGLVASTYTVFITDSKGCSSSSSYTLTEPPQLISNAGTDFNVCGETVATMNANTPTYGIGSWSVQGGQGGILFNDSTSANTIVSNLPIGDNVFIWTVTDGVCLASSQVLVSVTSAIQAIAGIDRKVCDGEINLNATRPQFGDGYWITFSPGVVIEDSSKAFSHVTNLNFGNNYFQWTVVNGTCRDSASVNIYRRDSLECLSKIQLPNAFSPNSDGFNDYFVVKGIEDYIKNDFIVYNRWGIIVYEKSNYQNTWNGVGDDGNPLPDGTYFILLKIDAQEKVYKTYVDLRR